MSNTQPLVEARTFHQGGIADPAGQTSQECRSPSSCPCSSRPCSFSHCLSSAPAPADSGHYRILHLEGGEALGQLIKVQPTHSSVDEMNDDF